MRSITQLLLQINPYYVENGEEYVFKLFINGDHDIRIVFENKYNSSDFRMLIEGIETDEELVEALEDVICWQNSTDSLMSKDRNRLINAYRKGYEDFWIAKKRRKLLTVGSISFAYSHGYLSASKSSKYNSRDITNLKIINSLVKRFIHILS